jgi:acetylornithine/succinyldiaminopimelate/putrescine aminotransferase
MDSFSDKYQMNYPISPFLAHTNVHPYRIDVSHAEGCYVYDKSGKAYLDFISGISVSNIGHRHPKVIAAIKKQLDQYMHVMVFGEFHQGPQVDLASKLNDILPKGLDVSYFVNSGTEANEAALKLAKRFTGRKKIISFKGAYHGNTHGSMSVSHNEFKKFQFRPLLPNVHFIEFNNEQEFYKIDTETACVIVEPIQGDAGVRIPNEHYLKRLKAQCQKVGALLIFDEIQTGFGRTGKMFDFEHYDVTPDILTIAKGFGGGMPIGAFISSQEIMHSLTFNPPLGHITTFGGHPVCCAAALSNIQVIESDNLAVIAEKKGEMIESLLVHDTIVEIRRKGLFFAIEMKDSDVVSKVVLKCKENGLLSFWFLSNPNSFRIAPPLIVSEEDIRKACTIILAAINEASQQ